MEEIIPRGKLLTENEVILHLIKWLENEKWTIKEKSLGSKHGIDIRAERNYKILIIEAKGAKADDSSKTKKREKFDSGQIHNHLGEAIIKILREMDKHKENNDVEYGIAQPYALRETLLYCLTPMKRLGIQLYWINEDGDVKEENQ